MERKPKLVSDLVALLRSEKELHETYLSILKDERNAIARNEKGRMVELSARRAEIHERIIQAQYEREKFAQLFPDWRGKKLTTLVQMHLDPEDQKQILPAIERLKRVAAQAKVASEELSSLTSFGLGMTASLLSLLWSGTQSVVRSYTAQGAIKEAFIPSENRTTMTLRHA